MAGKRLLLTGFEPFAGDPWNPSEILVRHVAESNAGLPSLAPGTEVITAVLPVAFARIPDAIRDLLDQHQPDAILNCGLAASRAGISLEQFAINAVSTPVGDNEGDKPVDRVIDPTGPAGRRATLDLARIAASLRADGIPVEQSFHAGTHGCNMTLYTVLGWIESRVAAGHRPAAATFVHLPYLPEHAAALSTARHVASMPLSMMLTAVDRVAAAALA